MNAQVKQAAIVALILLLATAVAATLYWHRSPPEHTALKRIAPQVELVEVHKQAVTVWVNSQGTIAPRTATTLVSEVTGKVDHLAPQFEAGALVDPGTVLLSIDKRNYLSQLERAKAAVASARSQLAQEQGRAAVAKKDIERYPRPHVSDEARKLALRQPQQNEAQANLDAALADLEKARTDLSRTEISAPYRAMVRQRSTDIGQYVSAGSQLGQLFAVDWAEVRLPVPANKLPLLNLPSLAGEGETPPVWLRDSQGQRRLARVVRSEAVVDERSRALFVVAQLADPYGLDDNKPLLRVGSFVSARIRGRTLNNLVVLPRHILRTGDRLWVVNDRQQLSERRVSVLSTEGPFVYVTEGLDEGERVVLAALPNAASGTAISITGQRRSDTLLDAAQTDDAGAFADNGADQP